jgi:hypothetical protein
MSKLLHSVLLVILGLGLLIAATPALTKLIHALIPLVLLIGVLAVIWRVTYYLTRQ